jgi:tetratricopeptide (TPR) repeat protein
MTGLNVAAMGRYEEAFALFDSVIALGRELGRPVRVLLNYSTMGLRDLYDLDESRARSEEALEQHGWGGFSMPRLNSLVDLLFTDLRAGEVGRAQVTWPQVWSDVGQGRAWQRWLLGGKMVAARAEIALAAEGPESAAEWASKVLGMAWATGRRKYEAASRVTLGRALHDLGRLEEAVAELRAAVADTDTLGGPPGRWESRAALGRTLAASGDDAGAEWALQEATGIIREVAGGLSRERSERFLAAPPIAEILESDR